MQHTSKSHGSPEILETPISHGEQNPAYLLDESVDLTKRKEAVERYQKLVSATGWKAKVFRLNFFRVLVMHVCLTSMLGAGILKALCPNVPFLDCYFTSVSALTVRRMSGPSNKPAVCDEIVVIFMYLLCDK